MQNTSPLHPLQIIEKKGYGSNVSPSPDEIKKKLIDKIKQDADLMKVLNEILSIRTAIKNSDVSKRGNPSFSNNENRIVAEFAQHVLSSSSFSIDTSNRSELIKSFCKKEGFKIQENQQASNQNLTSYFPPTSKLVLGLAMISASLPTVSSLPGITVGCSTEGTSGPNRNCPTAQAKQTTLAILFTSTAPVASTSIFPQTTAHNLVPSTTTEAIKIATSTSVENGIETTSIKATNSELDTTTTLKITPSTSSSAEAKEDTTTIEAKTTSKQATTLAKITTTTTTPTTTDQPTTTSTTIQTTSTTLPGTTSTPDAPTSSSFELTTTSTPAETTSTTPAETTSTTPAETTSTTPAETTSEPATTTSEAITTSTTSLGEITTSKTSAKSSTTTTAEATTTKSSSTTNTTSPAGTSTSTTQASTTSTPAETTIEITTTTVKPTTSTTSAKPTTSTTTAKPTTSTTKAEPTTSTTSAEPTTSTTSAEPTTSTTSAEPTTSTTKMTTTTAGSTTATTTTAGLTTSTTVRPEDTSQFPSTSLVLEGTTTDTTTGATTKISGHTTSTTPGTTSVTVKTSPDTSLNAEITTSPDGSYKITSPLTSAEIGCSSYMRSLSSDSSHEDVAKAMLLSLASIEHLRKISPDKMTSSISEKITSEEQKLSIIKNDYRLTLNEGLHCISQTNSSGVEINTTFANISNPCGANRRRMLCPTTPEVTEIPNPTTSPLPSPNSQQNLDHLARPLGLGLGLGLGIPIILAAARFYAKKCIETNEKALLSNIEAQTAPAASARATSAGATVDLVLTP